MLNFRSSPERTPSYTSINSQQPWSPGWGRVPVRGAGALLISIIGIIFSAIVLSVSDGQTLENWSNHWTFSPTVYLSIASTITNITLHYALRDGMDVSWWKKSMASNTTIGDLHRTWYYGDSFFGALLSYRHFNLVAIASILVTITPINGPLLQRASRVDSRDASVTRNVGVSSVDQIPRNYSGHVTARTGVAGFLTPHFSNVVRNYYLQTPIPAATKCQNTCNGTVLAAGWTVSCESSYVPYNMTETFIPQSPSNAAQIFQSGFSWQDFQPVTLQVGAQIKQRTGCTGNLLVRNCTLLPATVDYKIELISDSIRLAPGSTIWDDVVIGPVVNSSTYNDWAGPTTYGGFSTALSNRFGSSMLAWWSGAAGYQISSNGQLCTAYVTAGVGQSPCDLIFSDPMDDMLAGARELMFRAAMDAGSRNSSARQKITVLDIGPENIYNSEYGYLAGATVVSVLAIIFVTFTFHGYWRLGRHVTLSPIETAKAFNAPMLKNRDSNATVHGLLHEVGDRQVRYGAVATGAAAENLGTISHRPPSLPNLPSSSPLIFSSDIPESVPYRDSTQYSSVHGNVERKIPRKQPRSIPRNVEPDANIPDQAPDDPHLEKDEDGTTRYRLELAPPHLTTRPEAGARYSGQ